MQISEQVAEATELAREAKLSAEAPSSRRRDEGPPATVATRCRRDEDSGDDGQGNGNGDNDDGSNVRRQLPSSATTETILTTAATVAATTTNTTITDTTWSTAATIV